MRKPASTSLKENLCPDMNAGGGMAAPSTNGPSASGTQDMMFIERIRRLRKRYLYLED